GPARGSLPVAQSGRQIAVPCSGSSRATPVEPTPALPQRRAEQGARRGAPARHAGKFGPAPDQLPAWAGSSRPLSGRRYPGNTTGDSTSAYGASAAGSIEIEIVGRGAPPGRVLQPSWLGRASVGCSQSWDVTILRTVTMAPSRDAVTSNP